MNTEEYFKIHEIVFSGNYPGYKPNVVELPNGDGNADTEKRYAHISPKYLKESLHLPMVQFTKIADIYNKVFYQVLDIAEGLGINKKYLPSYKYSCLRILEYSPGAGSHWHTDFDLFTLPLYASDNHQVEVRTKSADFYQPTTLLGNFTYYGELMTEITGLVADPHQVPALDETRYSAVFFAMPDHTAILPSGKTVGEWVEERKSRSRMFK